MRNVQSYCVQTAEDARVQYVESVFRLSNQCSGLFV